MGGIMRFVFLLACLVAANAQAGDRNGQASLGAGLGTVLVAPWASNRMEDAASLGPKFGAWVRFHHDSPNSGFEISYDHLNFSDSNLTGNLFGAGFFWRYLENERFHPLWTFGLGAAKLNSFFGTDKTSAFIKLRAGVDVEMKPQLDVGFYLDHYSVFKDGDTEENLHALAPTVTLIYYFDKPNPPAPAQKVVQGTEQTKSKTNVAREFSLDVSFASGTAELAKSSEKAIAELAAMLREDPSLRLELEGHTDDRGSPRTNRRLSLARADAVREALILKHGISGSRITSRGWGSAKPVASNATEEGRRANRRVTARLLH